LFNPNRDGSASLSFHLEEAGQEPVWIHHQRLGEEKEYIFRNRQLKFRYIQGFPTFILLDIKSNNAFA
jgi:hypothetical protein